MKKKIEKILKNIDWYASAEDVVQTRGLLWRVNPEYAKEKANEIIKVLNSLQS